MPPVRVVARVEAVTGVAWLHRRAGGGVESGGGSTDASSSALLLVGAGPVLECWAAEKRQLIWQQVLLPGHKLRGIVASDDDEPVVGVWGGRHWSSCRLRYSSAEPGASSGVSVEHSKRFPHRILAAVYLPGSATYPAARSVARLCLADGLAVDIHRIESPAAATFEEHVWRALPHCVYRSAAWDATGTLLAAGDSMGRVRCARVPYRNAAEPPLEVPFTEARLHRGPVFGLAWWHEANADNNDMLHAQETPSRTSNSMLASCGEDRIVRITDVCERAASALEDKPDAPTYCSWTAMTSLRLQPRHALFGHTARPWAVIVTDDRTASPHPIVLSVGEDATCRLWCPQRGAEVAVLRGHALRSVWCVACLPSASSTGGESNVRWVATGGADATVRLYDLVHEWRRATQQPSALRSWALPPLTAVSDSRPLLPDASRELAKSVLLWPRYADSILVATDRGRVLMVSRATGAWTVLHEDSAPALFVPASAAISDDGQLACFGVGSSGEVLALQLQRSAAGAVRVLHRWRWRASDRSASIVYLHLDERRRLFCATPDAHVSIWQWWDLRTTTTTTAAAASSPTPAAHCLCPSTVHAKPSAVLCLDTQHDEVGLAHRGVVLVGHRSGHVRVHALLETTPDAAPFMPCIALIHVHTDRVAAMACVRRYESGHATGRASGFADILAFSMDGRLSTLRLRWRWQGPQRRLQQLTAQVIRLQSGGTEFTVADRLVPMRSSRDDPDPFAGSLSSSSSSWIAAGFHADAYGAWQYGDAQELLRVRCGGWRRPHDLAVCTPDADECSATEREDAVGEAVLAYWKCDGLHVFTQMLPASMRSNGCHIAGNRLRIPGHGMRINAVAVVPARAPDARQDSRSRRWPTDWWLISGAEDTALGQYRLRQRPGSTRLQWISADQHAHEAGVLSVTACWWCDGGGSPGAVPRCLVASAGGHDALFLWQVQRTGLVQLGRGTARVERCDIVRWARQTRGECLARVIAVDLIIAAEWGMSATDGVLLASGRSDGTLCLHSARPNGQQEEVSNMARWPHKPWRIDCLAVVRLPPNTYPRCVAFGRYPNVLLVGDSSGHITLFRTTRARDAESRISLVPDTQVAQQHAFTVNALAVETVTDVHRQPAALICSGGDDQRVRVALVSLPGHRVLWRSEWPPWHASAVLGVHWQQCAAETADAPEWTLRGRLFSLAADQRLVTHTLTLYNSDSATDGASYHANLVREALHTTSIGDPSSLCVREAGRLVVIAGDGFEVLRVEVDPATDSHSTP
ncbi:hypothetical protein CDCA_CDCA07G2226 [Cyanidium caldarium]|uniref:Uncharacterized protein n=1 Tax=Cyanidium caldarium TaxID=2771 RepID=A0AAV9IVW9_CYACA|nr:hypothetical protein CDCA_CDCA07G2226 [Cyanidium caldarium]